MTASTLSATAQVLKAETVPPTIINVYPNDLSRVNVSEGLGAWDSEPKTPFSAPSAIGPLWNLDLEAALPGSSSIGSEGLTLGVVGAPDFVDSKDKTKVRYQYYIGSGGYSALDVPTTDLNDVLDSAVSWSQTFLSGNSLNAGIGLQVQLEKRIDDDQYVRVTITTAPTPGSGTRDFQAARWFANTDMYFFEDGVKTTDLASQKWVTTGVTPDVLRDNFGDFRVVSFGPNLGRDNTYTYRIQDFTILGQTFHFTNEAHATEPEGPPVVPPLIPPEPPVVVSEPPTAAVPSISIVAAPILVLPRPELVVPLPVVNPPTVNTPPPAPTTQARVIADLGSTTAELLANYGALNNGALPPLARDSLTFEGEAGVDRQAAFETTSPFTASLSWDANSGDQWVDLWARSSPTYIGTFPVIDGILQIGDADLSKLAAGEHHLVFVGQTSGTNHVVSLTMTTAAAKVAPSSAEETASLPFAEGSSATAWVRWLLAAILVGGLSIAVAFTHRRRAKATKEPSV